MKNINNIVIIAFVSIMLFGIFNSNIAYANNNNEETEQHNKSMIDDNSGTSGHSNNIEKTYSKAIKQHLENIMSTTDKYNMEIKKLQEERRRADEEAKKAAEEKARQEKSNEMQTNTSSDNGVLTKSKGVNWFNGRKETYYNLDMSCVIENAHAIGIQGEYWVRGDGVKMLGNYIMTAASDLPKGTIIQTSLGSAIIVDAGCAPGVTDIAVTW